MNHQFLPRGLCICECKTTPTKTTLILCVLDVPHEGNFITAGKRTSNDIGPTIGFAGFKCPNQIGIFGANSAKNCRHAPQGLTPVGDTIAIAIHSRSPLATARVAAVRSAQIVTPKELFSTLQPVMMRPSFVSNAAPTWKFE